MRTVAYACLVSAALAAGHFPLAAAENAKVRHLASVYFDANGGGLNLPEGVACGANGHFVVGDTGNNRLLRFTYRDKTVRGGEEIKIPQLSAPSRVQLTSTGQILALDSRLRRIVQIGAGGEFKAALALQGVPPPSTIVAKSFSVDAKDNVYLLDAFSSRVLVLSPQGQFQKALAVPVDAGFVSEVAVDAAERILLLDSIKKRIFVAERDGREFAALGGDFSDTLTHLPSFMTDSRGIIFVLDGEGGGIVALRRDGSFVSRQLAMGWEEGQLNYPSQLCVNDKDEVFIADRGNSRIQVFQLTR